MPYLPLLSSRRASPPFGWYSFTVPRRMDGWVDLGGWLHTEIKWCPRESNQDTATHPSANRDQRRLTSLIESNALPLSQTATSTSSLNLLQAGRTSRCPLPNQNTGGTSFILLTKSLSVDNMFDTVWVSAVYRNWFCPQSLIKCLRALTLLVRHQEEHPACNKLSDEVWVWLFVYSKVQMICIWPTWCHCHTIISRFIKIHIGFYLSGAGLPRLEKRPLHRSLSVLSDLRNQGPAALSMVKSLVNLPLIIFNWRSNQYHIVPTPLVTHVVNPLPNTITGW